MSAKPQPMAGQSDAADDLIAELAKLMAQDANSDRPAEVITPAFSVRIPGGDNAPAPAPVPRFDFDRTVALAAEQPKAPVPTPAASVPSAPEPTAPEPFHFDFDLGSPKREPVALTPAAEPVEPAMAAESTVDHDSIADLIAADLSTQPELVSEPVAAPVPTPTAPPVASRAAPQPGANWTPTAVAANLGNHEPPARPALRPLNLQPAARAEQDRFKVPPVFGLGTTTPAESTRPVAHEPATPVAEVPVAPVSAAPAPVLRQPAPSVEMPSTPRSQDSEFGRDPIDEIEDLIGRAMRVEFDKPVEPAAAPADQRPAPSPALRTLATPVAPALSSAPAQPMATQSAAPRSLTGADEAILAAAQATGVEIGWVEAPEVDQAAPVAPAARQRARRSAGISRAVAGPLVAVTLLLAAGFGLYWVLGLGRESGPAPLLTADASPIKETPVAQPDAAAAQQSVVFNEIDGVVPGAEEQLVSRDQADVNEVTQVPPATDLSEEGLANRKVRTVTVRPDGTIVSGDDSVAGSAILPVDRPVVPEVPGAETASPELLASATPETTTPAAATTPAATPATEATPAIGTATPVVPGSTVPAVDATGNLLAGKTAPVPMLRPAGLQASAPTANAGAPVAAAIEAPAATGNLPPPPPANSTLGALPTAQPAVATTQPEAPAAQPATAEPTAAAAIPGAVEVEALPNSAPAYAQLASLRTEEEAREAAQRLVTRFGPLFGGANMEVQRVDLGARGIYYRVRVPADSAQAASSICTNVIAAGGDCVLM